uniref:Monocarboxylate transporter 12 n=1 Tax=Magallana gigas TaxID=29159 RepID=A0A8W8K5D4_MAGGI
MDKKDDCRKSSSKKADKPVVDGGWGWMVVFGAFIISVITDGCSYSFGVLFTHLVDYFQANRSSTAWVGSVFNAAPLLFGPFASIIVKRFGFRATTIGGGIIAAIGIFASVFANSLGILVLTYGCIAGFGISLAYLASAVVVMIYFNEKRSLATGLAESGAGIGTLVFAPLGWRRSLLILSSIVLNVVLCGVLFRPKHVLEMTNIPICDERSEESSVVTEIASEALSCIIVDDILGTSSLSDGYGLLMLIQGIANLGGPPLAGWLFDISGYYNNTFFAAGGSIVFLGMLFAIVPIHSRLYKQNTCKIN